MCLQVLRMMCIQSLCNGGLQKKLLNFYRHAIINGYGFEHIYTLENLEKVGLMFEQGTTSHLTGVGQTVSHWAASFDPKLKSQFKLDADGTNEADAQLGSLFVGYVPMSIRIAQYFAFGPNSVQSGGASLSSKLALLQNLTTGAKETSQANTQQGALALLKEPQIDGGISKQASLVMVAFVGGATNSEISAIRQLSANSSSMYSAHAISDSCMFVCAYAANKPHILFSLLCHLASLAPLASSAPQSSYHPIIDKATKLEHYTSGGFLNKPKLCSQLKLEFSLPTTQSPQFSLHSAAATVLDRRTTIVLGRDGLVEFSQLSVRLA
ncbi:Vacuolar protein sorting-associated protein 33A [Cichlidogyrus casuarinus]|uniref:Vacuolar protein sorting-associated protein 33A n=1 Tax=Cichlidogyrus casuarinus TaxID=1844966 RepID=A0ABD2QN40_9PLAT